MSEQGGQVKVFFAIEREGDWPPVGVESVWASPTGEPRQYVIENTPFFAQGATLGDVVVAEHRPASDRSEAEKLWFRERVKWAGNALLRLIIRNEEAKAAIVDSLQQLGCICEGFDRFSMVAVSVPPDVDQATVQGYLLRREEAGDVYCEEAILRD